MSALRDALRDLSEDVFFDLLENEGAYLLVIDLPGITAESVDLSVEDGRLSIEAQREKSLPDDYRYLEENRSLFFDLELPLPADASGDKAEAAVERGVLELTIPKSTAEETTIDVVDHEEGSDDRSRTQDGTKTEGTDEDAEPR
ncbi:Hsp20/alpha crystallin family protein [Halopiger djelfimassiliensis]|uniref:Hsp20/alpha crystallin family protein n=1 Tax=Halopiger djelfimassiliensis TaxID=1293047 RepID=UPI0009DC2F36|nr:Hsp20/alpha crystallin family protein [Halopiger djelfimassiliensis]